MTINMLSRLHVHHWLDEVRQSENLTNTWLDPEKLYYNFSLYMNKSRNIDHSYNMFLRRLNKIQSYIGYIYKRIKHSYSGTRIFTYLIFNDETTFELDRNLRSHPVTPTNKYKQNMSYRNDLCHPITPSDTRHSRQSSSTSHLSNMSESIASNHSVANQQI